MLNVKEAVAQAKQEIRTIFGEENISDVLLEEVDFEELNPSWMITVSFLRSQLAAAKQKKVFERYVEQSVQGQIQSVERSFETRIFKRVQLRAEDGKLIRISSIETGLAA
jgi:hypothetical protein